MIMCAMPVRCAQAHLPKASTTPTVQHTTNGLQSSCANAPTWLGLTGHVWSSAYCPSYSSVGLPQALTHGRPVSDPWLGPTVPSRPVGTNYPPTGTKHPPTDVGEEDTRCETERLSLLTNVADPGAYWPAGHSVCPAALVLASLHSS